MSSRYKVFRRRGFSTNTFESPQPQTISAAALSPTSGRIKPRTLQSANQYNSYCIFIIQKFFDIYHCESPMEAKLMGLKLLPVRVNNGGD